MAITDWFSTEDGVHIPIHDGQSKEEALKQFSSEHQHIGNPEKELEDLGRIATEMQINAGKALSKDSKLDDYSKGLQFDSYTDAWGALERKFTEVAPIIISKYGDNTFTVNKDRASITNGKASMVVLPGGRNMTYNIKVEKNGKEKYLYDFKEAFDFAKEESV